MGAGAIIFKYPTIFLANYYTAVWQGSATVHLYRVGTGSQCIYMADSPVYTYPNLLYRSSCTELIVSQAV